VILLLPEERVFNRALSKIPYAKIYDYHEKEHLIEFGYHAIPCDLAYYGFEEEVNYVLIKSKMIKKINY
jgi:hypothetical protein